MSFSEVDRAKVLAEALPYIQKYYGKTVVVKYGGNAMISDELRRAVISDIILLHLVGIRRRSGDHRDAEQDRQRV